MQSDRRPGRDIAFKKLRYLLKQVGCGFVVACVARQKIAFEVANGLLFCMTVV